MKRMVYLKKVVSNEKIQEIHNALFEAMGSFKRSLREDINSHKAIQSVFGEKHFPEIDIPSVTPKNAEERNSLIQDIFIHLHYFIIKILGAPPVWTTRFESFNPNSMTKYFKDWDDKRSTEQYRQKFQALGVKRLSLKRISDNELEIIDQLLKKLMTFTYTTEPLAENFFVMHTTSYDNIRNLVNFKNIINFIKQRLREKRLSDRKAFYEKEKNSINLKPLLKIFEYTLSLSSKNSEESAYDAVQRIQEAYKDKNGKALHELTSEQQKSVKTFSEDIQSGRFGKADPDNFNPGEN